MKSHTRHRTLPILFSWLLTIGLSFAEPEAPKTGEAAELKKLLQQGLFEEEATREFEKAAAAYEKLLAEFESHEQLAATALYRLAEVRRKQNRNGDAVKLYQKFIARFPGHDPLARLSRENLAALGEADTGESESTGPLARSDEEAKKIFELKLVAEESPDLLKTGDHLKSAIIDGHLRVVKFLLDAGISPDTDDALSTAAGAGHLALCNLLVDRGANLNGTSDDFTPLQNAIGGNREAVVRFLLEGGADPNLPEEDGDKPLILALVQQRNSIAKLLLEKGADPNINSRESTVESYSGGVYPRGSVGSPLHEALYQGDVKMANLLLDHDAGVNDRLHLTHITPLHLAAEIGDKALIHRLLGAGAKVDAKTQDATINYHHDKSNGSYSTLRMGGGRTPLYYAMNHDSTEVAEILLADGASFHDNWSLPLKAAQQGLAFAKLAFDDGIPTNFRGEGGNTLLHQAANLSRLELCEYLLDHGAELEAMNEEGATPLEIAFNFQKYYLKKPADDPTRIANDTIIRLMIARGADPVWKDSSGKIICLVSERINDRIVNSRSFWYPAIAGKDDSAVTVVSPELGRSWELPLKDVDPSTAVFPLTLLSWNPPSYEVGLSEGSRRSNQIKTYISWLRGTLYRKDPGSGSLEAIEFDLKDPDTYPALKGGDLLEFRFPKSFNEEYTENSVSTKSGTGWPQAVAAALNSGIEFKVKVRMEGAPEQLTLTGGLRVFDPTKKHAPIANAEELARLLGAEHPRYHNALLRVHRPGWGDIEAVKGTRAAKIELRAGDTLEVLPDPKADEVQVLNQQNEKITLVSPGLPFARAIDATEAPPSLLQLIAFAYGPYSTAAMEGKEMDWEEFLYATTRYSFQIALPHPDFSKIRILRNFGFEDSDAGDWRDGILKVDLTGAIASAGTPQEARAADIALRAGDIVELPVLKEALDKPWTGFDQEAAAFLRKAMTFRVNTFDTSGEHQPVILQYEPPGFAQTRAGLVIYRRNEDSVYQTDISTLVRQLYSSSTNIRYNFKAIRQQDGEDITIEGQGGYNFFLRDMDAVELKINPSRTSTPSRVPLASPSTSPPRRRVVLPQSSSR